MPPTAKVNNVWGQQAKAAEATFIHTLPSGQTVELKKVGIDKLLEGGLLSQFETLAAVFAEDLIEPAKKKLSGHSSKKPTKAEAAADAARNDQIKMLKLFGDPDTMKALIGMADVVCPLAVVCPPVRLHYVVKYMKGPEDKPIRVEIPIDDTDRVPVVFKNDEYESGFVYTDEIDFLDKLDIMQEAVDDLATRLAEFQS